MQDLYHQPYATDIRADRVLKRMESNLQQQQNNDALAVVINTIMTLSASS